MPRKKALPRFGWIPDLPDQRDFRYEAVSPALKLPLIVDLRPICSPIEDQGSLGSCTAQAIVGVLEFLEKKNKKVPFINFSRLFVYYNERVLEGTVSYDSGAQIRNGIKTVVKQGVCDEKKWPYVVSKFKSKPNAICYSEALQHQVISYHRISTLNGMKTCLADGFPFVFGFRVYESFMSKAVAKSGRLEMPRSRESAFGGHAVVAVGYNEKYKRFIVRNSWGLKWGRNGYFDMPYAYLTNRNLSDDFWTVRKGEKM